jgi:hypothetical protein
MSDSTGLQFERVEGAAAAATACAACQRSIPDAYYEAAGKVFCEPCKDAALVAQTDGSRIGRLFKAVVLGSVAAALCSVGWYAIVKLTGYEIGLVAIVVGLVVGGAVRVGSQDRGGWPYQIIAVLLTYVSIGVSYVPLVMDAMRVEAEKLEAAEQEARQATGEVGEPSTPASREAAVVVGSVAVALMLPVLQVMDGGFVGLLIVGFALYQAWKMNVRRSLAFSGPFRVEAARAGSA